MDVETIEDIYARMGHSMERDLAIEKALHAMQAGMKAQNVSHVAVDQGFILPESKVQASTRHNGRNLPVSRNAYRALRRVSSATNQCLS